MALTQGDLATAQEFLRRQHNTWGSAFVDAVTRVLLHEGGLSSDVRDNGGLTKYGISQRAYPLLNIRALTIVDAIRIYRADFWLRGAADRLQTEFQLIHFDGCVNHGVSGSGKALQRAYNSIGLAQRLVVDGVVGFNTIRWITACTAETVRHLLREYFVERMAIYIGHEDWPAYGEGWTRRLGDVYGIACVEWGRKYVR